MTDADPTPPGPPPDDPLLPWPVAPHPEPPHAGAPRDEVPPAQPPPYQPPRSEPPYQPPRYASPPPPVGPPPASPWPVEPAPVAPHRQRAIGALAVVAALALLAGTAAGIALTDRATDSSGLGTGSGSAASNGTARRDPLIDEFGSSNTTTGSNVDVRRIATAVSPAIVNIASTLQDGNQTAGSGIILTSSGEVLTNNHVINGAQDIQVEIGVTRKVYAAKVLGYDVGDDIALIQMQGATGLKTVTTATSSSVSRNDEVVAIGNALGRFGPPSAVGGTVTALHQSITAGDGLDRESLDDMIRIAASIQPGDSGGALVNTAGQVIGINTAADSGGNEFRYTAGTTGFAIPIERALSIAHQIRANDTSGGAHIGDRALLGVVLAGPNDGFGAGVGAEVTDIGDGSPAAAAGIQAGDTITALGGHAVRSGDQLRTVLERYHPHDRVVVTWTDSSGDSHHATVTLTKGPPT